MTDLFITTALLGVGYALITQLKEIPTKLFNRVRGKYIYTVKVYQYDELFTALEVYMKTHHLSKFRDVEAFISNSPFGDYPCGQDEQEKLLNYRQEEDVFIVFYKGKRLIINKLKEKLDKNIGSVKDVFFRKFIISGWRAREIINLFLQDILDEYNKKLITDEIKTYIHDKSGYWDFNSSITTKSIDDIILKDNISSFLIEDIEKFYSSKNWYVSLGIPYKRGYCFYGPPGTGKTSVSLAIASKFKKKVYYINLNALEDDGALVKCLANTPKDSIILIEDIDKAFSGRESLKEGISFSTLLNCLDGVLYKEGSLFIITTNFIEKLDPALIRPGRIDTSILIENPGDKEISRYLSRFFVEDTIVNNCPSQSMGTIQGICIKNRESKEQSIKEIYQII